VFTGFWIFVKPKRIYISLLAILTSIPNIISTFAFNYPGDFTNTKSPGAIRVLTWNVALMNYTEADTNVAIKNNAVILNKIAASNADILCLQEFFTSVIPGNHYNLMDSIARTLHYPYYYFSRDDEKFDKKFYNGTIIFSRFKIIDSKKITFPGAYSGSVIGAGFLFNNDTIDIVSTRLQSVKFKSNDYRELNKIKTGSADGITGSKNIITKLRAGYQNRLVQIAIVNKIVRESKRPLVLTGDMNDVPVSYTYSKIKNNMTNAWIDKGFGLGKTFKYISPTLRIDHIFFNEYFKGKQVSRIMASDETDHHAVVADLILQKKE
jgi:endonuclease/exonuclease/phosphatase family metal-dependent hydrolase